MSANELYGWLIEGEAWGRCRTCGGWTNLVDVCIVAYLCSRACAATERVDNWVAQARGET